LDSNQARKASTSGLSAAARGLQLAGLACHFPWIYGGKVILGRFVSERAVRIQGWVFGACMLLAAAHIVFARV
jgi:homoserine/homoserine lactone efflux protein